MPNLHSQIQEVFKDKVVRIHADHGDETVIVRRDALIEILTYLKQNPVFDFNMLIDLTAVDGLEMKWKPRFETVYHLYSLSKNHRLRIKVQVDEKEAVLPSAVNLWPAANWFEREVWDMFGIRFEGHPNLKRILLYEEFQGHPLRKDYPVNKRQPLVPPRNSGVAFTV